MPFEPNYHIRDGFAQFKKSDTLYVDIKCDIQNHIESYQKWLQPVVAVLPLHVKYSEMNHDPTSDVILVTVNLTDKKWHGASRIGHYHYKIDHNYKNRFNEHMVQHEFVHILGVPHEIHNPLVHYCLKPDWQKVLNWKIVRDDALSALLAKWSNNGTTDAELLSKWNWLSWHAETSLEDMYYCFRWTIFSDDVERALMFDPYCSTGGSTDLFHLYMDQVPNTNDIFVDQGILEDDKRLMTKSLERFFRKRFANEGQFTDLKGRKPWFGDRDECFLRRFLPDVYLQQMTHSNPFFKTLIEDKLKCVEDMNLFRMDTLHRFVKLPGVDLDTKNKAQRAIAKHKMCNPKSEVNYISFWNSNQNKFDVCVSEHMRKYCATGKTGTCPPGRTNAGKVHTLWHIPDCSSTWAEEECKEEGEHKITHTTDDIWHVYNRGIEAFVFNGKKYHIYKWNKDRMIFTLQGDSDKPPFLTRWVAQVNRMHFSGRWVTQVNRMNRMHFLIVAAVILVVFLALMITVVTYYRQSRLQDLL